MMRWEKEYNTTMAGTMPYRFIQEEGHRAVEVAIPEFPSGPMHLFGLRGRKPVAFMAKRFAIPEDRILSVRQVHGDSIRIITNEATEVDPDPRNGRTPEEPAFDALITDRKGYAISVQTADCLPILMWDENRRVAAAVHAGWRGSLLAITAKTVLSLESSFGIHPRELWVAIGPAIGPCCYEVDRPVLEPLRAKFDYWKNVVRERENGRAMLDLAGLNIRQLADLGVDFSRITSAGLCTFCHPERFYSFRRDGRTGGGMINGIMICA